MLDHAFSDAIGALREALEVARLERLAIEERFQADLLLGDLIWKTSYGLPGEGMPPKARCDITLEWPTRSQTAYRQWNVDGEYAEPPQITIEITLRLQHLLHAPDPVKISSVLDAPPPIGTDSLEATGPTVETIFELDLDNPYWAIEFSFEGVYELKTDSLEDGVVLDRDFNKLGGWVSRTLVRLGDLDLLFRPFDQQSSN